MRLIEATVDRGRLLQIRILATLNEEGKLKIKYLDVGPQAQLPPPYVENISALLTMVSS